MDGQSMQLLLFIMSLQSEYSDYIPLQTVYEQITEPGENLFGFPKPRDGEIFLQCIIEDGEIKDVLLT